MAREKFEDRRLHGRINVACKFDDGTVRYWDTNKEDVVAHIKQVLAEYAKEGYVLTLRQLHYQLVTQNWIINHDTAYKKLGSILDDCRYSGQVDWSAIEDRGRVPYIPYSVDDVEDALKDTIEQYRLNRQDGQDNVVELWTEKDALSGILKRSTQKYHVHLVVNKGYTSSSAIYNAYQRVLRTVTEGKKFVILYFGDHDPSGLDMVRDITDRLMFMLCRGSHLLRDANDYYDELGLHPTDLDMDSNDIDKLYKDSPSDTVIDLFDAMKVKKYIEDKDLFKVNAIGLTMAQIKQFSLPPNPTKLTDSRSEKYIKKFGKTCWEVDALNPRTLTSIVEKNIIGSIDGDKFNRMLKQEQKDIKELETFIKTRK